MLVSVSLLVRLLQFSYGVQCFFVEFVLSCLNSFHNSIQFTYEIEKEDEIPFLDILILRSGKKIETRVYRKSANTDI